MRIRLLDIGRHGTQRRRRESSRSGGRRQRSEVLGTDRNAGDVAAGDQIHHGIIWGIEQHVVRHVAEVTLVADSIAAAEGGFAVAENIPREAEAGSEIRLAGRPQLSDRTLRSGEDHALGNCLKLIAGVGRIEVGIESSVYVVLHAEILVAKAKVYRYAPGKLPGILNVGGSLVIAVAALKCRRAQRQCNRAGRRLDVVYARILSLRIDGSLERIILAHEEIIQALSHRAPQDIVTFLVCAEGAIVAKIFERASETNLVLALDPGEILISFAEVLGTAKGDRAAWSEGQVSRKADVISPEGARRCGQIIIGHGPFRRQRLITVKAVEIDLRLRN